MDKQEHSREDKLLALKLAAVTIGRLRTSVGNTTTDAALRDMAQAIIWAVLELEAQQPKNTGESNV